MPAVIGVIGDFNPSNPYHGATNGALRHAGAALNVTLNIEWIPTIELAVIASESGQPTRERSAIFDWLNRFDGLFASPGSPYRSMEGALAGIRFARERGLPFTGT